MKNNHTVLPEETLDPDDWEAMRALGHRMVDDMLDHLKDLRERPVWQHAPQEIKAHFDSPRSDSTPSRPLCATQNDPA